jgi:hypothetical protein
MVRASARSIGDRVRVTSWFSQLREMRMVDSGVQLREINSLQYFTVSGHRPN